MKIIVTIRRTTDYQALNKDKFLSQKVWRKTRLKQMYEIIETWDKLFKIKYFDFRHQLRSISGSNWISIPKLDLLIPNVNMLSRIIGNLSDNYFLLFVDDDDWFNPIITREIEGLHEYHALNWRQQYFMSAGRFIVDIKKRPAFFGKAKSHFYTNNYIITKKGYESLDNESIDYLNEVRWSHEQTGKLFFNKLSVKNVEAPLSMTNKTMASVGELWRLYKIDNRKKALIDNLECALTKFKIPKSHLWAKQHIMAVRELHSRL